MLPPRSPITPLTGARRKATAGRTPLQPKNTNLSNNDFHSNPKPNPEKPLPIPPIKDANKENNPAYSLPKVEVEISSMDASLAEELSAVRKRVERARLDRESTEKMLRERDRILEIRLEEIKLRGEFQKELEIEVDRLYRLNQIHVQCMRTSPIRSLREREMKKRSKESPLQSQNSVLTKDESVDRSVTTTPSFDSECTSEVSSAIRALDCSA